jgi:hypothetical protein
VVDIEGGASADRLRVIVESVADADNIGEIGIGLNPAARIGDEIAEAKKAFGTVHIALGDSANEYGGLVECDVHLDVPGATVEFDGVGWWSPGATTRYAMRRTSGARARPGDGSPCLVDTPRDHRADRAVEGRDRAGGDDPPLVTRRGRC